MVRMFRSISRSGTGIMWMWMTLVPGILWAQGIRDDDIFTTKVSKTRMTTADRVRVEFILKRPESSFHPPEFTDFYVVMGPGVSQSYRWINGREEYSKTYTYILQPKRAGTLQIGPAVAEVEGKTYRTEPIVIEVTQPENEEEEPVIPLAGPEENENGEPSGGKDIFLRLELTERNPYVNQAVGAVYKLYIKKGVRASNLDLTGLPEFKGFWVEKISDKIQGPYDTDINGVPYSVYYISKVLLFPQQPGTLKIAPLKARIIKYTVRPRQFGPFITEEEIPERLTLTTGTVLVRVKPLPEEGRPETFDGAVGNFDISLELDRDSVQGGEPVELTLTLRGTGNLGLIDLPDIDLPPSVEKFEPEVKRNYRATLRGFKGEIRKIYTLIPRDPGKYVIPPVRFAFFDSSAEKYVEIHTREHMLTVGGRSMSTAGGDESNKVREGLHPLMQTARWRDREAPSLWRSRRFWVLMLLPFLIALAAWGYKEWQIRRMQNPAAVARRESRARLQALLDRAASQTDDKTAFYGTLENILRTYFRDRLGLAPVNTGRTHVVRQLRQMGVPEDLIRETESLWLAIETARYTPAAGDVPDADLSRVKNLIRRLDKTLDT